VRLNQYVSGLMLLLVSATAIASGTGGEDTGTYRIVLFLHQVLFVFWLGPDIGVFMWSTKVTNPELTPAQRVSAGRMMGTIELIPKVCMSLMLTVGGTLTELMGIEHPWWQMAGIVLLGPVWLTLTLLVYFRAGTEAGRKLADLDLWFRWLVLVGVIGSVGLSLSTGRLADTPWITGKLLIFAAVVFFSIMMRMRLRPFDPAINQLEATGPSPELDKQLAGSVGSARLFMIATWVALALAAGLGMVQPGGPSDGSAIEMPAE
jgi:hypothetical protein